MYNIRMFGKPTKLSTVISNIREVAVQYRVITGSSLKDPTGVIGEYIVADLMNLTLAPFNQRGYDAVSKTGIKYQVKSSTVRLSGGNKGQFSSIKTANDWNYLACLIMSELYKPIEVYVLSKQIIRQFKGKNTLTRSDLRKISKPTFTNTVLQKRYYPKSTK